MGAEPVAWSKGALKRTLVPGQRGLEQVTLTARERLTGLRLTAESDPAVMLAVSPELLSLLEPDQTVQVTVSMTVPAGTPTPSKYEARIRVWSDEVLLGTLPVSIGADVASARPPEPSSIVRDHSGTYPVDELFVVLRSCASVADGEAFAEKAVARLLGAVPKLCGFQIAVPARTPEELTGHLTRLRARPEVKTAFRNYLAQSPATDLENLHQQAPDRTRAWDAVGVRRAFQIMEAAAKGGPLKPRMTVVGIVDTGLQERISRGTLETGWTMVPHPEFEGVDLGASCRTLDSCTDQAAPGGHGTQVAGILGANNFSESAPYRPGQMNGILAGIPQGAKTYRLEERAAYKMSAAEQVAATESILGGPDPVPIVLLEILFARCGAFSQFQRDVCADRYGVLYHCGNDLAEAAQTWSDLFAAHREVLFVLPAGNYDMELPELASPRDAVNLVGGFREPNTITVGAFDPDPDTKSYRSVWGRVDNGVCTASNYGWAVELAGPGSLIYAPKPTDVDHLNPEDFYTTEFGGTSGAAPFVAGAAGVVYALDASLPLGEDGKPIPATAEHLKRRLLESADPVAPEHRIGNRLNVCRAVKAALGMPDPPPPVLLAPVGDAKLPADPDSPGQPYCKYRYTLDFRWTDVAPQTCESGGVYGFELRRDDVVVAVATPQRPSYQHTICDPPAFTGWSWTVTATDRLGRSAAQTRSFELLPPETIPQVSSARRALEVGGKPYAVAAGDFNGDRHADLAVTIQQRGKIAILLGGGDGTFRAKGEYPSEGSVGIGSIVAADLNGDGKTDLATVGASTTLYILFGNGDGSFGPASRFTTGGGSYELVAGDFNRDGKMDLVAANTRSGANTVSVLLGAGGGKFASKVDYTVGPTPYGIAVADFNRDRNEDLAVASLEATTVAVLLGKGDGAFHLPAVLTSPWDAGLIAAMDFNSDGLADLAFGRGNLSSVVLGNGDGTFGTPIPFFNCNNHSMVAGDFNLDGKPDLASGSYLGDVSPGSVCINLGTGEGTFTRPLWIGAGVGIMKIAAADFNEDGRPDIVAANTWETTVTLLLIQ